MQHQISRPLCGVQRQQRPSISYILCLFPTSEGDAVPSPVEPEPPELAASQSRGPQRSSADDTSTAIAGGLTLLPQNRLSHILCDRPSSTTSAQPGIRALPSAGRVGDSVPPVSAFAALYALLPRPATDSTTNLAQRLRLSRRFPERRASAGITSPSEPAQVPLPGPLAQSQLLHARTRHSPSGGTID